MIAEIKEAAKDGDSLGGVVEVLGYGVPVGLGSHVHWDRKLDAPLAQALMSIQAVKGVEIGDGFEVAGRRGSEAHDPIRWDDEPMATSAARTCAGGVEGGMSTGEPVVVRAAMKPLATLNRPTLGTVDIATKEPDGLVQGAHRRHRRARAAAWWPRHGRAGAGRRGAPQVRRRLGRRAGPQPPDLRRGARRRVPSVPDGRRRPRATPRRAGRADGLGQDHRRAARWRKLHRPALRRRRRRARGPHRSHRSPTWFEPTARPAFRAAEAELLADLLAEPGAAR